ncbi:MAG: hypothetical protein AAGN46_03915 [Acidobacteriota bacterium]
MDPSLRLRVLVGVLTVTVLALAFWTLELRRQLGRLPTLAPEVCLADLQAKNPAPLDVPACEIVVFSARMEADDLPSSANRYRLSLLANDAAAASWQRDVTPTVPGRLDVGVRGKTLRGFAAAHLRLEALQADGSWRIAVERPIRLAAGDGGAIAP